jgi:hypothetical protein
MQGDGSRRRAVADEKHPTAGAIVVPTILIPNERMNGGHVEATN